MNPISISFHFIWHLSLFFFFSSSFKSAFSVRVILIKIAFQVLQQLREETASMRGSQMQVPATVTHSFLCNMDIDKI